RMFEAGFIPLFKRLGVEYESEEVSTENPHPAEISVAFELCRKVARRVAECRTRGLFPIVLSGNCNTAVGTVSGCGPRETGVIWFDAHGEATTPETTVSGFLDGMPISTLLGRAWQGLAKSIPGYIPIAGNRIVLFGARALGRRTNSAQNRGRASGGNGRSTDNATPTHERRSQAGLSA